MQKIGTGNNLIENRKKASNTCLSLFLFFLVLFFLTSCNANKKPPTANFIDAYIELRVATEQFGSRPEAGLVRRDILKKYGFTRESFDKEATRLRNNYELWQSFEDSLQIRLDTLISQGLNPSRQKNNAQGSSVDKENQ